MAKTLPDLYADGIGDLTKLMHNQGVSDLSWLAVEPEDYHAAEALPKQNLDIIPEFQKALISDTKDGALDVPRLIPMKPHTIVNRNPLSNDYRQTAPTDQTAPIRNRVAKMVMMGLPNNEIAKRISLEFAPTDIRLAASAIKEVIAERGLLGNVYVNADHFPRACHDPKERQFARIAGKNAVFVLGGCDNSNGCDCRQSGICKTFGGKRVVAEVPYDLKVVGHYAAKLANEGRLTSRIPVGSNTDYKEVLRVAFNRTPVERGEAVKTIQTRLPAPAVKVSQEQVDDFWHRKFSAPTEAPPSPAYLKFARRMMAGSNDVGPMAASGVPELVSLAKEYGILGHSYLDMDALGGCKQTLEFILAREVKAPMSLDFVIRRSASCQHCRGTSDGACAKICEFAKIVSSKPETDRESFLFALQRAVLQRRLTPEQVQVAASRSASIKSWPTVVAHINLHTPAAPPQEEAKEYSGYHAVAKHMEPARDEVSRPQMDAEEVRRSISHMMNTGLSGKNLQAAILKRYTKDDLQQVPEVGRRAAKDDGVQGIFFIDPTAYRDYGKGCNDGAKAFRKQGAPHVLAASGCTGCILQTHPGWCSKYAKSLIRTIPTQVRQAAAQARRTLPVIQTAPIDNSVEQFGLASELAVEPAIVRKPKPEISIAAGRVDE